MNRTVADNFSLIFLHIPKNAGSSTHTIFNKMYATKNTYNVFGSTNSDKEISDFIGMDVSEKRNIKLLKGHMPFGLHAHMEQNCKYFTIIREPVKRLISQYNYILRNDDNPHHNTIVEGGLTISDVIEKKIAKGFDNAQCRFLTNRFDIPFGELPDDTLDLALENINRHFIFLGLTEKFDLSMLILSKLMKWKNLPYYRMINTHSKKTGDYIVSAKDNELIRTQNKFDVELYNIAGKRFDDVLASDEMADVMDELTKYQARNKLYQLVTYPFSFISSISRFN